MHVLDASLRIDVLHAQRGLCGIYAGIRDGYAPELLIHSIVLALLEIPCDLGEFLIKLSRIGNGRGYDERGSAPSSIRIESTSSTMAK